MERSLKQILALTLCLGFSFFVAASLRTRADGAQRGFDFAAIYVAARCTMQHQDPYNRDARLREFKADGGKLAQSPPKEARDVLNSFLVERNLPTTFFAVIPFAMLSWPGAQTAWLGMIFVLLTLAAFLMWNLGAGAAPLLSGCLACFILGNCEITLVPENLAFICIPLCVVGAWCFLKDRYGMAGVMLMAVSLVMKPHDAGFVWLYFLLAGGSGRKRALQTLAVAAVLGVCATLWIMPASPHWAQELRANLAGDATHGGTNDSYPAGGNDTAWAPIISLQVAGSAMRNDARFYNPFALLIGGGLILAWGIAVSRKRGSQEESLLALAAVSILTLLPVYHRCYDGKLLLLAIPACAMLWARGGVQRRTALGMTAAAIAATSDIPISFWVKEGGLHSAGAGLAGKLALLSLQPAPLVLLAAGCFYLWVYIRWNPQEEDRSGKESSAQAIAVPAS